MSQLKTKVNLTSKEGYEIEKFWEKAIIDMQLSEDLLYCMSETVEDQGFGRFEYKIDPELNDYIRSMTKGSTKMWYTIFTATLLNFLKNINGTQYSRVFTPKHQSDDNIMLPISYVYEKELTNREYLNDIKECIAKSVSYQNAVGLDEKLRKYSDVEKYKNIFVCSEALHKNCSDNLFALNLILKSDDKALIIEVNWDKAYITQENMMGLMTSIENILSCIVRNLDTNISLNTLIHEEELKKFLNELEILQDENCVDDVYSYFEKKVTLLRNETAIIDEFASYTYDEVDRKINQIANYLKENGIKKGDRIALMFDRSIDVVLSILAILKLGVSYIPIDTKMPQERVNFILNDSGADAIFYGGLANKKEGIINIIYDDSRISLMSDAPFHEDIAGETLAYIIYTSGTTGTPKGVMVNHSSIINTLTDHQSKFPMRTNDVFMFKTSYAFDVSVAELFGWFFGEGALYVLENGLEKDVAKLRTSILVNQVTHINFTPSMFNVFTEFVKHNPTEIDSHLKYLLIAGETFAYSLREKALEVFQNIHIENLYGPTENTIYTSSFNVREAMISNNVPIGKTFKNVMGAVINKQGSILPRNVKGELVLFGHGLAKGYVKDSDKKFFEEFENRKLRGYKTGDLVSINNDENILFYGRIDRQVKIRGYRIELLDIEENLKKLPPVKDVYLHVNQLKSGESSLIAYVTIDDYSVDNSSQYIKSSLSDRVPEYMIPKEICIVDSIPLNINGKVDSNALNKIRVESVTEKDEAMSDLEKSLQVLWQEVLETEASISMTDNFFEIGGHSLLANMLILKISEKMNINLNLNDIFECQTIRELSKKINTTTSTEHKKIEKSKYLKEFPLSMAQYRLYFLSMLEKESTSYNMPFGFEIEGQLKIEDFEKIFQSILKRHELLRARVCIDLNKPYIKIEDELSYNIAYEEVESHENIESLVSKFIKPFDLTKDPLVRVKFIKFNTNKTIILGDMHHIISDGASIRLIMNDMVKLLNGEKLSESNLEYKDYVSWEQNNKGHSETRKMKEYWFSRFSDKPEPMNFPLDYERQNMIKRSGNRIKACITSDQLSEIQEIAKNTRTTIYTILLSAYYITLWKYSNTNDITVGTPVENRLHVDLKNIVGMFVNTLALRNTVDGSLSISEFIENVKRNMIEDLKNQAYSFDELVMDLSIDREATRNPLFDTMFSYEDVNYKNVVNDYGIREIKLNNEESKFDFSMSCVKSQETIDFELEYATELFDEKKMESFLRHYIIVLEKITVNLQTKINDLVILDDSDLLRLKRFNETSISFEDNSIPIGKFHKKVAEQPNSVAMVYKDEQLTYKELDKRANKVANFICKRKARPEEIVGIMTTPCSEMIIGILGILKAGCAYAPIDTSIPLEQKLYIEKDCDLNITLTKEEYMIPELNSELVDFHSPMITNENDVHQKTGIESTNLFSIIYTSGTTGVPKGVMLENRNITNLVNWYSKKYDVKEGFNGINLANYTFDASIENIMGTLLNGGTLHIVDKDMILDRSKFIEYIKVNKISIIDFVPTMLKELLSDEVKPETLKHVTSGGEKLPIDLKDNLLNKGYSVCNNYGPTETTVDALSWNCKEGKVLVGSPIANVKAYILDDNEKPVPITVVGEIYIGGTGVTRGYLNKNELTNEKFKRVNIDGEDRVYRTGDLGRWTMNGEIEYLGRVDNQVKIRGHRIELEQIENKLLEVDEINGCVVLVKTNYKNENYLVAYVELLEPLDLIEMRNKVRSKLVSYMIPSEFISVPKIPLNKNGKADRKGILNIKGEILKASQEGVKASTNLQMEIEKIWSDLLEVKNLSVTDNFFDIGGTSLKLIEMQNLIEEKLKLKLDIIDFFEHTTIKEISDYIETKTNKKKNGDEKLHSKVVLKTNKSIRENERNRTGDEIAIIGAGLRFPGANDLNQFWTNLVEGKESLSRFTADELAKSGVSEEVMNSNNYVPVRGIIEDLNKFDPLFFNYTPKDSDLMDPQLRLLHKVSWEALESAGYSSHTNDHKIGTFIGGSTNVKWLEHLMSNQHMIDDYYGTLTMNMSDFFSTRISHKLNLTGPSMTLQTACSSSLSAIHMACQSILCGDSDMAIAGGVSIVLPQKTGYHFIEGMINSKDGHCRAFDDNATGTVSGNGAGIVVLKRLEDAIRDNDNILSIIKASSINNDGTQKIGYTAPSITGQSEVIKTAIRLANIDSEKIKFVETHGTGTILGDPIEIKSLTEAYNTDKKQFCAVGSVKSNIGHLDNAAGVAGVIKSTLALKNRLVPRTVNYSKANEGISFNNTPFFVNDTNLDLTDSSEPIYAGVSAFGIGGTNVHLIMESYENNVLNLDMDSANIFLFSAESKKALQNTIAKYGDFLKEKKLALTDIAYTLANGRKKMRYRTHIVADTMDSLLTKIENGDYVVKDSRELKCEKAKVIFMFPGQGSQYIDMGKELYDHSEIFSNIIDECLDEANQHMNVDLKEIIFSEKGETHDIYNTYYAQPIIFAFEYSIAKYLMKFGIFPDVMIGHSIGEYAAACISGVMTPKEAIRILVKRGKLMNQLSEGAMLSVLASPEEIEKYLNDDVEIAAYNTSHSCTISGTVTGIEKVEMLLRQNDILFKRLKTQLAFHSKMMDSILSDFEKVFDDIELKEPQIEYLSNVTGEFIRGKDAMDPRYYSEHIVKPVRFYQGIEKIQNESTNIFIEVGPGKTLSSFTSDILKNNPYSIYVNTMRHKNDETNDYVYFLSKIGDLENVGLKISLDVVFDKSGKKILLPTYGYDELTFDLNIKPKENDLVKSENDNRIIPSYELEDDQFEEWTSEIQVDIYNKLKQISGVVNIKLDDDFFELGMDSLKAVSFVGELSQNYEVKLNQVFQYPTIRQLEKVIVKKEQYLKDRLEKLIEYNQTYSNEESNEQQMFFNEFNESYLNKVKSETRINNVSETKFENILLTGVTGYLGIHILKELLDKYDMRVSVLIRADKINDAKNRLKEAYEYYFDMVMSLEHLSRIDICIGDISEDLLGMTTEKYLKLSESIDSIIHSAGNSSHFGVYEDFYNINVRGTIRVLELAKQARVKSFNHISTMGVFAGRYNKPYVGVSEFDFDLGQSFSNHYTRTKYEAEEVIQKYRAEGLNINIYRLGNISFHSKTGKFQKNINNNALYSIVKAFASLKKVPRGLFLADFGYVDFMSRAILKLIHYNELENETYHLYNHNFADVLDVLIQSTTKTDVEEVTVNEFLNFIHENLDNKELKESIDMLRTHVMDDDLEHFQHSSVIRMYSQKTQNILSKFGLEWRAMDKELSSIMMSYCKSVNYISDTKEIN